MLAKKLAAPALVALALMLGACATSRSELTLPPPPAATPAASAPAIVIRSVTDARTFEAAPRDPSVPSFGTEGGGADIRARAVARKRNTYGQALGDVLLAEGETVEGVVRQHATAAFNQGGVRVIEESAASPETPRVDISIGRFWAWFQPGFWEIKVRTKIETTFTVAGSAPVVVAVETERGGQAATDGMWREGLNQGLEAYRAEVAGRANQAPFVAPAPQPGS